MNLPSYHKLRYVVMALSALITLAVPFIRINENHLFLLSFDHMRLDLFFIRFDAQEFYTMPFVLMFGFLFVFAITTLGGRIWCGWGCPQTIFRTIYRDLIEGALLGMRRRTNKQKAVDYSLFSNKLKKAIAVAIWVVLAFVAAANFCWFFVPPEDFFTYIQSPADHPVLMGMLFIVAGFLIFDIVKMGETFCAMICPYVRVQSSMYDRDTIYTIYDETRGGKVFDGDEKLGKKPATGECTGCEACVHVCPTHIDIRKGLQLECINCLECADACAVVMNKLGKPSLVNWTSARASEGEGKTKFLRFRTIAYGVLLACVFGMIVYMGGKKEAFLLDITKSARPYKLETLADGTKRVSNDYVFLFSNTSEKAQNYYFEIVSPKGLTIATPSSAMEVDADSKDKMIVVVSSTDKSLAADENEMTRIELKLRAYDEANPEKIAIERKAIFFFPPKSELK